jgi:Na+-driven multidrug efflux pump
MIIYDNYYLVLLNLLMIGAYFVFFGSVVGMGKQILGTYVTLFGIYGFMIPLSYLLAFHTSRGFKGLFEGSIIGYIAILSSFVLYFYGCVNWK